MKKFFKFSAVVLAASILFTSCIGSFSLTNKLKDWNESLGDKFVNELVFICMHIVPVYELSIFADVLVINSIEFWTGSNPIASKVGETKIVKNSVGDDVQITTTANGYEIVNGEEQMQLVFDEAEKTWSAVYGEQSVELMKFVGDNSVEMYSLNGNTVNISLDAEGMNVARMMLVGDYAMGK